MLWKNHASSLLGPWFPFLFKNLSFELTNRIIHGVKIQVKPTYVIIRCNFEILVNRASFEKCLNEIIEKRVLILLLLTCLFAGKIDV